MYFTICIIKLISSAVNLVVSFAFIVQQLPPHTLRNSVDRASLGKLEMLVSICFSFHATSSKELECINLLYDLIVHYYFMNEWSE